ncbi:MAG TPA: 3' terminal RNA ribose 2'-O-methyltransferase Hen1 [Abditibacteriaceae bacterium]|jgi:3' terminal RNA ribose 2'-O-methyltransferase Hen1
MLLTISTTHQPATDLGYLLAKNPARVQTFDLNFGKAHIFYPEAQETLCTAALLLDIDPVGLVRKREGFALSQYVNDRPYVASSFLSVAMGQVLRTALSGRSRERPELAQTPLTLEIFLSCVPCKSGAETLHRLFTPLGFEIETRRLPLDEKFPEWGESFYYEVRLKTTARLGEALTQLYVLLPVLDGDKHYWIGEDEVEKLLRAGGDWLSKHPEKEWIVNRYLRRRRELTRAALERLMEEGEGRDEERPENDKGEETVEEKIKLHDLRLDAVRDVLKEQGARRILDLGCGEGRLLKRLINDSSFTQITGMDVSVRCLEIAARRLHLETLSETQRSKIQLLHGSLIYRDARLEDYDAAAIVEVIEHLDEARLAAFERVLWEFARPQLVVLTTPNREYNVQWPSLPAGKFRHADHRFEWTRSEFQKWAERVAQKFGYNVAFRPLGPEVEGIGAPSQMAIFNREATKKI